MTAPGPRAGAIARLLRFSLFPSVVADVLAGMTLGSGEVQFGPPAAALLLASLCVFHGAMALNDWADREFDAATRPDRPIPSGGVSARSAFALASILLGAPLVLLVVSPGMDSRLPGAVLLAVACLAVLYDVGLRGPWIGPVLLGLCRGGNLSAGLLLGAALAAPEEPPAPLRFLVPVAYGLYVFFVARLGRLEDREERDEHRRVSASTLFLVVATLLLGPALLPGTAYPTAPPLLLRLGVLAILLLVAIPMVRLALADRSPCPATIERWMGVALGRLVVFTAAAALLAGGAAHPGPGIVLLLLFPFGRILARRFPPS